MTSTAPLLIAGPTASGKSNYALKRARQSGAVIINADSMQVYQDLQILTARPTRADEAEADHRLYGHVDGATPYSVGRWLEDVARELKSAQSNRRPCIIVGGTGLYFRALLQGLAPIPEIPNEIRDQWRNAAKASTAEELHRKLVELDPATAAQLRSTDPQRIVRALEVFHATGRPLTEWQQDPPIPLLEIDDVEAVVITRAREELYARADDRFDRMIESGAMEEIEKLCNRNLSADLPIMRALGVPALCQLLKGDTDRATAIEGAKQQTRQYIKRQLTWLRGNMITWKGVKL